MKNNYKEGDLVYITPAGQEYLNRSRGEESNISYMGRLGKVLEIYDWKSKKGKDILRKRKEAGGTWNKLKSVDFKYVIVTYYPELRKDAESPQGLAVPELFCEYYPMSGDEIPLFSKWPLDMLLSSFEDNPQFDLVKKDKARRTVRVTH